MWLVSKVSAVLGVCWMGFWANGLRASVVLLSWVLAVRPRVLCACWFGSCVSCWLGSCVSALGSCVSWLCLLCLDMLFRRPAPQVVHCLGESRIAARFEGAALADSSAALAAMTTPLSYHIPVFISKAGMLGYTFFQDVCACGFAHTVGEAYIGGNNLEHVI